MNQISFSEYIRATVSLEKGLWKTKKKAAVAESVLRTILTASKLILSAYNVHLHIIRESEK